MKRPRQVRTVAGWDKQHYREHLKRAKLKNIEWFFTFETWLCWWEINLGPDWRTLRGKRRGQFVMARLGDKGPYHPANVECITASKNISDAFKNEPNRKRRGRDTVTRKQNRNAVWPSKLTRGEIMAIFESQDKQCSLAKAFNVSSRLVRLIKKKQIYKHLW